MLITSIIKRDGRLVEFDSNKITAAIIKASTASTGKANKELSLEITIKVLDYLTTNFTGNSIGVEHIQDIVEKLLIEHGDAIIAKSYILYRDERSRIRNSKSTLMNAVAEILIETSKENANISNSPSAKMLQIASAASKAFYLNRFIPKPFAKAHMEGYIHIHDLDFYAKTMTCVQIPLGKLLTQGFNNGHGYIRSPKRISSASALAAIILQSSQNDMFGGQSFAFFDRDMAPFVGNATKDEVFQAMEALIYNLNSMHSRAGAQVPFSSLNLGTDTSENGRLITEGILLAYEKGLGHGEIPIFPNIIFRVKEGINLNPKDINYDLFKLALRVASTRMNPTFSFMDSSFNKEYGDQVGTMGCRTRIITNVNGPEVTDGRGNLSFTTINLPRLAIESKKDILKFYESLSHYMNLVINQLIHRYEMQCKLKVKDLHFLMGQGVYLDSEKLKYEDTIEPAIKHGSLSVGFIGLAETLISLVGYHHGESNDALLIGREILQFMRYRLDRASREHRLNFSLLATPAEGLSGRFIGMDKKLFGEIKYITDKEYYTNSFHVPVDYEISAYDKIIIEGSMHKYANAGHISYVEFASPPNNNLEMLEDLIHHMNKSDIGYAGFNFPIDFCETCNYTGVINTDECPACKSTSITRVRRITGYLSSVTNFNDAKQSELHHRKTHNK